MKSRVLAGSCLCGTVRYRVPDEFRYALICHCSQCRKTSGHFVAASQALSDDIQMVESSTLKWYRSSPEAERGFCSRCGGNLFWRPDRREPPVTSIMAGTLDAPTGLRIIQHIFVQDKSDYYEVGPPA